MLNAHGGRPAGILRGIEHLFEVLTFKGVLFSSNLFMYEKSQVTLKGILRAIDPDFDVDAYLAWVAAGKFLSDIFHLRFHWLALEEAWRLYWRYFSQVYRLQIQLFRQTQKRN